MPVSKLVVPGPEAAKANARFAGQAAVGMRHHGRGLLMTHVN